MVEKSDYTTNGSSAVMLNDPNGKVYIDTSSDPGSWKKALQYSQHIKVIDGN